MDAAVNSVHWPQGTDDFSALRPLDKNDRLHACPVSHTVRENIVFSLRQDLSPPQKPLATALVAILTQRGWKAGPFVDRGAAWKVAIARRDDEVIGVEYSPTLIDMVGYTACSIGTPVSKPGAFKDVRLH